MEIAVGTKLAGRYVVEKLLGRGGMGSVFLAFDEKFGERVALKVASASGALFDEFRERFVREARIGNKLGRERGYVRALDWGELDGATLYLSMDLVEGATALDLRSGTLTEKLRRLHAAAQLVAGAHAKGVVHRDLKPANFLLGADGQFRLSDFGLAKVLGETEGALPDRGGLTQTGSSMGTPIYMPPEQFDDAKSADERADVYALGVMLFLALTDQPPFGGRTASEIIRRQEKARAGRDPLPRASFVRPGIAPALDDLCQHAIALERDARLESVSAFAEAIAPFLAGDEATRIEKGEPGYLPTIRQPRSPSGRLLAAPLALPAPAPVTPPRGRLVLVGAVLGITGLVAGTLLLAVASGRFRLDESGGATRAAIGPALEVKTPPDSPRPESTPAPRPTPTLSGSESGDPKAVAIPPGEKNPSATEGAPRSPKTEAAGDASGTAGQPTRSPQTSPGASPSEKNGRLSVRSQPARALVLLDGTRTLGRAPLESDVPPGRHVIVGALEGYQDASEEITLAAGEHRDLELVLPLATGRLTVETEPAGASVRVASLAGGAQQGETIATASSVGVAVFERVPVGVAQVTAARPGFEPATGEARVVRGTEARLTLRLKAIVIKKDPFAGLDWVRGEVPVARLAEAIAALELVGRAEPEAVTKADWFPACLANLRERHERAQRDERLAPVAWTKGALLLPKAVEAIDALAELSRKDKETADASGWVAGRIQELLSQVEKAAWWKPTAEQVAFSRSSSQPLWREIEPGLRVVLVPPGTFQMGSPPEELGRFPNETLHSVTLTRGYYVATTEVTNEQFLQFDPRHDSGQSGSYPLREPKQPVVEVSSADAVRYCAWLQERLSKFSVRLPSEAEWERACRAGTDTERFWGTEDAQGGRYANVADWTWLKVLGKKRVIVLGTDDGHVVTANVGSFEPNPFGLFDMIGNVSEWCSDALTDYEAKAVTDPAETKGLSRVRRGGSWNDPPRACRSASRDQDDVSAHFNTIGFRVIVQPK